MATMYLVTGGCGFIGSYIVRDLVEEGERVVIYDFYPDQRIINQLVHKTRLHNIVSIKGDVTDLAHLMDAIKAYKVTKIIHLASPLLLAAEQNPHMALNVICQGTLNVFEAARLLEIEKVVWASSIAIFGAPEDHSAEKIRNNSPHRPNSVYGACKSLNEYMATHYADKYGMDIIGLRYTIVYGPGRVGTVKGAFATEMIRRAALGKPYEVPYSDQTLDWQYVEDVSKLTVIASRANKTKTKVFNTKGDLRPVREVVDYLKGLVPEVDFDRKRG